MNSMDGSSMNMTMTMGMMTSYLHFGTGDTLLFKAWQPTTTAALAGACIGLILFCVLERCLAAVRRVQEYRWKTSPSHAAVNKDDGPFAVHRVLAPPFAFSRDVPRGVLQALQATCSYALMLAVMTFNAAFLISIVLGLGVGEMLVGRIGRVQKHGEVLVGPS